MKLFLIILRVIVCLLLFFVGFAFAGYTNELVKPVLTSFDRVVLMIGFMLGLAAAVRWLHDLEFWVNSDTVGDE